MKKLLVAVSLVLASLAVLALPLISAQAGSATHRIVFELTSDDAQVWEGVLNNVENVRKALPGTTVEVVAHGKGLALLLSAKNASARDRLRKQASDGVAFAACENRMKRQKVTKEQLVPFAKTVDSGVAEIVRKQEAHWSYLRVTP